MLKFIKSFFGAYKEQPAPAAPYKVETPAEQVQPVVEAKVDTVAVALDLEPMTFVAEETPAKKTRKPRAPKAEKPAAKKAAPKKAAAIKATKKSKKA